ncbi:hypothetical protein WI77_28830 [Burkholderia ubonensis]|uniref:DUF1326 domain-containing protein n=1 Tax=Burkholderia ubonensis TaxID=101571 RepID=UPI0007581A9B|nr:DUF1326 domain-containing protein [Burkholderia ubonensis]KVD04448.1 hypothetical protein WI77_28830 [Burkholderia ubonensis]KVU35847.1 hypothetical protein WK65_24870 [Burkholderia ubonensis]
MTPWEIQGTELMTCNCSYGCPCQFSAPPTNGFCEAMGAISIGSGHYGDVRLDCVNLAVVFQWPGPIHEGKGKCQPIVDERASPAQRDAVLKIMTGQDTEPFATMFSVFASTLEHAFDPIFAKIDFDVDVDARRGRIHVEGVFDVVGEPIRNPVTGAEHRARIDLPHGFEYELAEIGSGTSRSHGNIALDLKDTYAQFARLHMNNTGLIRHRTAA